MSHRAWSFCLFVCLFGDWPPVGAFPPHHELWVSLERLKEAKDAHGLWLMAHGSPDPNPYPNSGHIDILEQWEISGIMGCQNYEWTPVTCTICRERNVHVSIMYSSTNTMNTAVKIHKLMLGENILTTGVPLWKSHSRTKFSGYFPQVMQILGLKRSIFLLNLSSLVFQELRRQECTGLSKHSTACTSMSYIHLQCLRCICDAVQTFLAQQQRLPL